MTGFPGESGTLRICAGVLHYRSWPEVRRAIDGLLRQSRPPDEIIVVDHASRDGSAEEIRAAYPQLELVELTENRGPAGGMNRLMETVLAKKVDAILCMTDDTELAPRALERLAARLEEEPELGAVGPVLAHLREPERVFAAGGYIDARNWDLQLTEHPDRLADWEQKQPHRVDHIVFGGNLIRAEAAREVGLVPGHFYHELDDVDFNLRLATHGWKLECVPDAVAWLDAGDRLRPLTVGRPSPYLSVRNKLGYVARNAPRRMLVRQLLRVVKWLVLDAIRPGSGSRADLIPRLRGLIDFCRGRWGEPPVRP
jgi:GT2 family glycosyltransferase